MEKELETLSSLLKALTNAVKDKNKKSKRAFDLRMGNASPKQIQKASTELNWCCMYIEKLKQDFARAFDKSSINVGVEEKEYNPSGFHNYKH